MGADDCFTPCDTELASPSEPSTSSIVSELLDKVEFLKRRREYANKLSQKAIREVPV